MEEQELRQSIAERLQSEIGPLLDLGTWNKGYNCCGCGTYYTILEHAIRIVKGEKE
jgi:hypothetical protein